MRWVVNAMPRSLYPGKEKRYPPYRMLSGPHGRSGRVRKISPSHRDSISEPSSRWRDAIPTKLPRSTTYLVTFLYSPLVPWSYIHANYLLVVVTISWTITGMLYDFEYMLCHNINLLRTEHNLLYINNQSVTRCKRFPPRL
jgi:hypothetical protein